MVDFSTQKSSIFTAAIQSRPDVLTAVLGRVRSLANDFGQGFELDFFEPVKLLKPIQVTSMAPNLIMVEVHAAQCPPALLRILWGMCEWARIIEFLPIEWLQAKQDETVIDLKSMSLPPLAFTGRASLDIVHPDFIGMGEQIVVLMQFHVPLDEQGLALLESGLGVWSSLLCGGLPPEGSQPGESGIGATTGYFITPTTYQWYVEGLAADPVCIDLLLRFLAAHADQLALASIDIEA